MPQNDGQETSLPMLEDVLSEKHHKRKERRQKIWLVAAASAVVLVIVGVLWFFLRSPFFQIRSVTIEGNQTVSETGVRDLLAADILAGHGFIRSLLGLGNILAWPSGELPASGIDLIPQLADVSISKNYFSHSVAVSVTERQPFAIWCEMPKIGESGNPITDESCFWFDKTGTIFEKAFDTQGSALYAIHDYSQTGLGLTQKILPDAFIADFMSILDVIRQSGTTIKEVALKNLNLQELDVSTYGGPDVYFSLRFSAANDLPVLQSLMAKPNFKTLQYIDFRVENRAYYK
jgi:hypothetical protein